MAVRGSASLALRRLAPRYPFLPGAEIVVESVEPSLREMLASQVPIFSEARRRAEAGLRQAARGPATEDEEGEFDGASPEVAYLTFQYSRVLLSMPGLPSALYRRWCVFAAKSFWRTLVRRDVDPEEPVLLARQLGLEARRSDANRVAFGIPSYIHMATPVREVDFRLAKQDVAQGEVIVEDARGARLLQEAIRLYLLAMPKLHLEPPVVESIAQAKASFLEELHRLTPAPGGRVAGAFEPALFPPCIVEMRAMMDRGENLSHFGRFTLAAYLHRVGAEKEFIVDCFRGAPDFDEEITRYQVDHISSRDEGKGYSAPECANIQANGLCFKERDPLRPSLCLDPTLRHPVNYYFRRKERKASEPPPKG